jgi:uncharacterized protein (DUF362 family)
MNRREFFKKSLTTGVLTSATLVFGKYKDLFTYSKFLSPTAYDLVAIKGGEPDVMFDKAIASLGGMKAFVKKGQTVIVKPNIGWDVSPERGGNTNPALVNRIIKRCFEAGAKDVYVFDHTCDDWKRCYSNSGIERAAKDAGAKVVSGASEGYYQEVPIKKGEVMKNAKVHELVLSSDVFINVPILKSHGSTEVTIGMKNLMGIVWDRKFWHRNDLHKCIADFASYRKPDLTIVDAYYVMKKNGPRGISTDDIMTMKSQLLGRDIVAVDSAAAKLFGVEPKEIDYLKFAEQMKLGTTDLNKLSINRIIM